MLSNVWQWDSMTACNTEKQARPPCRWLEKQWKEITRTEVTVRQSFGCGEPVVVVEAQQLVEEVDRVRANVQSVVLRDEPCPRLLRIAAREAREGRQTERK